MEYQFNIRKIFDAIFSKLPLLAVIGILSIGIGFYVTDGDAPDTYMSSSSIYSVSYSSYRESVEGLAVMRDYVDIVKSRKVAERAASYLPYDISSTEIMGMISASYVSSSAILTISAVSFDPAIAVDVVNAATDAFVQEMSNITAVESVKVLDPAYAAIKISDGVNDAISTMIIICVAAVFVTLAAIVVFSIIDTRVAFHQDVTLSGEIDLLGVIPNRDI